MGFERTIFLTYMFETSPITGATNQPYQTNVSYGYSNTIHCNYIQRIETDTLFNKTINFVVPDGSLFPFLKSSVDIQSGNNGYGFTAKRLLALVQIVNATGTTAVADPANWSIIDVTPQLDGYAVFSGTTIPVTAFNSGTIITIPVQDVLNASNKYNLSYLSYPTALSGDTSKLAWGEEAFFYGNVKSEIEAIAYTTDISVVLPLNAYNSTTNETWDELSAVQISEVGLFDDNNVLVAIGKLNNPIAKDSNTFRTIQFSIDF